MKSVKISAAVLTVFALGSLQAMAQTVSPSAGVWVDASKRTVTFAPTASLSVALTHIGADETYWDQIDLEMSYDSEAVKTQIDGLKAQYPGYSINRATTQPSGDFVVAIPALGINEKLTPQPGVDGPYVSYQAFIPRAKAEGMRSALRNDPSAASLKATAQASVQETKTIEHVELPESICDELAPAGIDAFGMMKRIPAVYGKVDQAGIRLASTKDALKKSIFEKCFELETGSSGITSVSELLSTSLRRTRGMKPFGDTISEAVTLESFSVQFALKRSIDGTGL